MNEYLKPGMSEETQRAILGMTSEDAFERRTARANAKASAKSLRACFATTKANRKYYSHGAERFRYTFNEYAAPERVTAAMAELQELGVSGAALEVTAPVQMEDAA